MKHAVTINLIISASLILLTGLFSGYTLGYFQGKSASFPEIKQVEDLNPGIPTVKLLKNEGGIISGRVDGAAARLAYSQEHIDDLQPGETFEIPAYQITLGSFYAAADLPEDAQYIASSQGKYFYHILDPKAFKITPKNRLYFTEADQALKKGFLPAK
jgi:hypothetical protein